MFARDIHLVRGQALVLVHADPELRTMVVRAIAKVYGTHAETTAAAVLDDGTNNFTDWMRKQLNTLVLDGMPTTPPGFNRLKAAITKDSLVLAAGQGQVEVAPPNFIFCTSRTDWLPRDASQRRYRVVQVAELEGCR